MENRKGVSQMENRKGVSQKFGKENVMKALKALGANRTQLEINGHTVFFSYNTPVAASLREGGFIRTETKYSVTTSKHITQWLAGAYARTVPQHEIDALLGA